MVFVMKSINSVVLVFALLLVVGLGYSEISLQSVSALPPDPCFGKHSAGCPSMSCSNSPATLTAHCCWLDIQDDTVVCQTCDVNTDTGEFENCTNVSPVSKGTLDGSIVAPSPSGKAPPSTEKCPDNVAVDKNGNCSPITQTPNEDNDGGGDKPNLRDNVLNDMMFGQSQGSSVSENREGENNRTEG